MLNRKSYSRILERALRKCEIFRKDTLYAECTPVEYLVLCKHFSNTPNVYFEGLAKKGDSGNSPHYFTVVKFDKVYPVNPYAKMN